ncbi:Arp Ankyrin repeat protein [Curvularia clavata]|uniref:Arp Ankyrin repeat protein n=1 Tax=Curvularia clavata TaxID=95742 RepID=A0A9Q8Z9J2_CURCL|nr:Arp Ankyrin repeat protein [Curvularia clavata]
MDPLSVTASIIAVLQLSAKVLEYLNDVKDASKDRVKCAVEAANAYSLLVNLRFRLEDGSADAPWYTAVRALGVENGPLDQFKQALEELQNGMTDKGRLHRASKALVWKFKKEEIRSILGRMERLKTLVGIALEMDHFKLSQAIQEDVSATKSQVDSIRQDQVDEKHEKMTEWISPTNYPAQQSDIMARRQEGTGQWFLDAPEFTKWINEPKGTLFCPGIPGAGKTMVAAIVIDHLLKSFQSISVGVAYVYCNYKAQEQQSTSVMLASIIKQLVQSRPSVIEPVARLHKQHDQRGTKPSLDEIFSTLQEVLAEYSTVYLVIDALDECKDSDGSRRQFLAKLQDLQAGQDVRLMATSRFIPEIEEEFKQAEKLEIRASEDDVRQFVAGQMYRLPKCIQRDSTLQQLVEERIPERVDGMFLLARLHVDSLLDKTTAKKVKTALDNLSKGSAALDNAYKDALQRIESQLDGQCELAKKVLSWITYAKRPLTTAELCCALAVEPQETELDPDNLPDPEDLLSVCAGLVIVDQESAVVRLVHYTTQEFFQRIIDTWNPGALLEITSTCLTYLSFDKFQTGKSPSNRELEKKLQENKFLDYAAKHWGEHALVLQNELYVLIHSFLCSRRLVSCATQVFLAPRNKFPGDSGTDPESDIGLHLAARFGLSSVIEKALTDEEQEQEAILKQQDGYGYTLLYVAAMHGHYGTTELLLEKSAQMKGRLSTIYNAALQGAAAKGDKEIIELLLRNGADLNARGEHETPLIAASLRGHKAIVELLLEKGAEVNASRETNTPLSAASFGGHKAIVELLLEKGAEVNANKEHNTPLIAASFCGHRAVIELLLDKGAEVNIQGGMFGSALQAATAMGKKSIVEILLEKGAEVNMQGGMYGNALSAASAHGHESIVRLLLEKGAEINVSNSLHGNALQSASAHGHESIVRLLLEKGAETNVSDSLRGNALQSASAGGHETIVKLLLEKGAKVDARDFAHRSALDTALAAGHEGVARILRDAGASDDENPIVTLLRNIR